MNTQERKTEALALLALDEWTDAQVARLNQLTAMQAGYEVKEAPHWLGLKEFPYALHKDGQPLGGPGFHTPELSWAYECPDYVNGLEAVGRCLALPLPDTEWGWWVLTTPRRGKAEYYECHLHAGAIGRHPTSLAIAMLRAWWRIQKDD